MYIPQDSASLFAGKTFLVVDDFQGMRSLLREMLRTFGTRNIDTAANGKEALALLEKNKYDAVLCDNNLGSGKTGQHILEEARHRGLIGLATAWIIITAEKTADLVYGAAEQMPDDYIIKPVNEATMRSRLEKALAKKVMLAGIEKALLDGHYDRAIDLCDRALASTNANTAELLRIKTDALLTTGRYDRARQEFEHILARRDIPWAKTGLGKVAFCKGDLTRAQQLFREVVDEAPSYLDAYDWLARSHEKAGEPEAAQLVLARCAELSPNSVTRQQRLGEVALELGDLETAASAFRKTIRLGRFSIHRSPSPYIGLARVCSENDEPAEALQILKDVCKEFDGTEAGLPAKAMEGMIRQQSGDRAGAEKIASEVAELVKAGGGHCATGVMLDAVRLCLSVGNREAAASIAQTIVRNNHENTEMLEQVSDLYDQAGLSGQGEELVDNSRREVIAINDRGVSLASEGNLEEGIRLLRDAHAMLPDNKRIMINLANMATLFMQQNGRNDDMMRLAGECLGRVARLDPQDKWCAQMRIALETLPE